MNDPALDELEGLPTSEELDKILGDAAVLGDDTVKFIKKSTVGRSLVERAKNDLMKAMLDLVEVSLDGNLAEARAIQLKARTAKAVIGYLGDNIREGAQALSQLEAKQRGQ